MSTIIMSACWPLKMPPSQKSVLVSLADNANDEGVCWPSVERIVERTCLSDRTVQKCLVWLEERGAISRQARRRRSTVYTVSPSAYRAKAEVSEDSYPEAASPEESSPEGVSPEDSSPEKSAQVTPKNLQSYPEAASPRIVKELKKEPSLKESPRPPGGAKDPGRKKTAVEFKTFVQDCQTKGEKLIGDYAPVLTYCEDSKLPAEFANLCWAEFKRRHSLGGTAESKRYADWRKAFLNCVQSNWYGLWYADAGTGAFALTTKGVQAENVAKGAEQ